jgi:uncharacterized membrane protein
MRILVALAALLTAAPAIPQEAPPPRWTDATPPVKYQRTGFVPVFFVPPHMVQAACSPVGQPPAGLTVVACTRWIEVDGKQVRIVVMPDPCAFAAVDPFAAVQCHENSHFLANRKHETE